MKNFINALILMLGSCFYHTHDNSTSHLLLSEAQLSTVEQTPLGRGDLGHAGDVASLPDPRPKAGVFAVRQGPILADNIRRSLEGEDLLPFHPQRAWLALISLSNGRAIADKWGLSVSGRGVQAWKHWNDTRFLRKYACDP